MFILSSFVELSQNELITLDGGWNWSEWFGAVSGAAATGAAIGSAVPGVGNVVGGVAGAVLGNAFYALADYYDKK